MQPAKYEHTHAHKEEEETELFVAAVHRVGDCLKYHSDQHGAVITQNKLI